MHTIIVAMMIAALGYIAWNCRAYILPVAKKAEEAAVEEVTNDTDDKQA